MPPPIEVQTPAELARVAQARQHAASGTGRLIRKQAGLSLGEVARVLDCSPSTVLRWERCEDAPSGHRAVRYAELLERLLGGRDG